MDNIYISIIVPAYNIENYIGRCLDSLLEQRHKALEIIVINDGSTDGTGRIIDEYAAEDQRIISIHKENGGVSSARLAGIERATGTYIGFVDGDDYVEPDMYYHLLQNSLRYQCQISHCGYKIIFPDGHEDLYYGTGYLREQNHDTALEDLLRGEIIEPSLGNKLYHKSVLVGFTQSPIWNKEIRINEDLLMNYLFFKKASKSIYEDKTFYHYILRRGSATTIKRQRYKITDPLKVIELIKEDTQEDSKLAPIVYCRYLRALISVAMQTDWIEDAVEAKNRLIKESSDSKFAHLCSSFKLKLMVAGVAYAQPVYRGIRSLYEKITGVSKKFEIK